MKRSIKVLTQIISVVLSVVLLAEVAPLQAYAQVRDENAQTETAKAVNTDTSENTDNDSPPVEEPEIIAEDEARREESVKHYIMSDGTMQAAQYDVPVHYENNGEWTDYDNTLIETDADDEENKGKIIKNKDLTAKSSDWNIRISKKTNGKKFVRIERDGYKLSWYYLDAKKSTAEVSQAEDDGDRTTLETLSSTAYFKEVYKNTDLEYILSSNGLKENIILNSADTKREFVAEYKVNGLVPVQLDSKTIELQNTDGKAIYILAAPYMTDVNGNLSDGVNISLSSVKNNTFTVTTTLDTAWLDDENRAYPVTVDPVVMTKPDAATIQNKYITSKNYNLSAYGSMYVGKEANMGPTRSAVKFTSLPALDKGDMVTSAALYLGQLDYQHVSQPELQINAYEITSAWSGFNSSKPGIYSTSNPAHDSRVLDYHITNSSFNYKQIYWDITSTVKKWYNGGANNGIFLAASDTRWAYAHLVSKHNNIKNGKPVMTVQYINNRGIEDYWSFTEQSLGGATGYVNNYTGNLVLNVPIGDTGSASLPAGISYYYNGYQAGKHFAVSQGGGVYESSKSVCGSGWKTTVDERLSYLPPQNGNNSDLHKQGIKYTYTDADGTVLYMKEKKDDNDNVIKNTFEDELGKGYTLRILDAGGWELTDKQNNKKFFTSGGRLWKVQSNQSQDQIVYHYTGDSYYYKVVDGSGKELTITRNANNAITGITSSLGTTKFDFYGSWLTKITYPDGGTMQFAYDSENRLTSVTARDGSSVTYSYPTTGDTAAKNRVIKVTEYSAPNASGIKTVGNSITFDYNIGNYTKVTDNKGRSIVYNFDSLGRTTSAVDEQGATSAKYTPYVSDNGKDNRKYFNQNNKLTASSTGTMPIDNLLTNTSFERDMENWHTYYSSTQGSSVVDSSNAYIGKKSIKLYANAENLNTQIYQKYYPTKAGKYTFSFHYKTDGLAGGKGIRAIITIRKKDGSVKYVNGAPSLQSTNGEWQRLSVTADITSDVKQIDTVIILDGAKGNVYVDCAQLEYGGSANPYNMVENSAFKNGGTRWANNMQSGDSFNTTHGSIYDSGCPDFITNGVFIKGDAKVDKYVRQDRIPVNMPANKVAFQFSGYACAKSVKQGYPRYFALDLGIHYSDGSTEFVVVDFNGHSTAWQYVSQLVMPSKNNQSKHVEAVTPYFLYYQNQNFACFSGMNLTIDKTGNAYSYDEKGNVISAKDMAERESIPTIDSANRLTGYKDEENARYKYTYNTDNASTGATKYQVKSVLHEYYAQMFEFKYDRHGNVIHTSQRNNNGTIPIQTNSNYSANGDRLLSATDSLRNTVTYNYSTTNPNDLRVQSITQNGATVKYTYKPNTGLVTGVSSDITGIDGKKQTISNTYNYTNDRLTSINHNGFNYNFTYDDFGNRLSTSVGNQTLMTNTYGANNGLLTKSTYGNGAYVENIYDRYDRVTGVKYNGVQKFGYEYDANGAVSRHTDNENGKTYNYTYDMLGRLQRTDISDGSSISYTYDKVNNTASTRYQFSGSNKYTSYSYFKGGVVQNVTYPNGAKKTRSLNAHAQVRPSTLTTPTGKTWDINRQYYTPTIGGVTYTTNVMGNLIYDDIGRTFSYSYDGSGNISKIADKTGSASKESTFVYDEANQLIRENNPYTNKTVTYTYDKGGNILTKTEYPFTTGSLDGLTGTVVNYTYGNSNWKDLLTEFDGKAITYDEIGNPLKYYNGTQFTWNYGRKLSNATTADGKNISYKYNADGIRTQKTVNGVTTEYFLDGSTIIAEKTDGNTIWYYYDGDGTREAIEYKGNVYYYFYNAQGDVMGLFDDNLNIVVEYTYDSWGNVESITGSLADTLGQDNPFRYRGYYFDSDTGLYYLNSRYYDSQTGRFINADNITDGEAGLVGNNLFVYGANNPINNSDPSGNWIIKDAIKWVAKNVVKPVVKAVQNTLKKVDLTQSHGLNISGTVGAWSFNAQIGVSSDTKGNIGIQAGFSGGITNSDSFISVSTYSSLSNAKNIDKLNGKGYQLGGSVSLPYKKIIIPVGADFNVIPDIDENKNYYGMTFSKGIGFGDVTEASGEIHAEWGETATVTSFNVFDFGRGIYQKIMEW